MQNIMCLKGQKFSHMIPKKNAVYLVVLMVLYACGNKAGNKSSQDKNKNKGPVVIDVSVAKLQDHSHPVEASGSVLANEFVELKPEVSGRIVLLNIQEGKNVSQGTLLVKLFDD